VGKKLARRSAKNRAISLNNEKQEKLAQAEALLTRWGQLHRQQHQPTYLPLEAEDEAIIVEIEDKITSEVILAMSQEKRQVAEQFWSDGKKPAEIASQQAASKDEVRDTLSFIRDQVINKALG
jgi:hypothetical protein